MYSSARQSEQYFNQRSQPCSNPQLFNVAEARSSNVQCTPGNVQQVQTVDFMPPHGAYNIGQTHYINAGERNNFSMNVTQENGPMKILYDDVRSVNPGTFNSTPPTAIAQSLYQNYAQNLSRQRSPNIGQSNGFYVRQNSFNYCHPTAMTESRVKQANASQQMGAEKPLGADQYRIENGQLHQPLSVQASSTATYNTQAAHNQNYSNGYSNNQHGARPSQMSSSKPFGRSSTIWDVSSGQCLSQGNLDQPNQSSGAVGTSNGARAHPHGSQSASGHSFPYMKSVRTAVCTTLNSQTIPCHSSKLCQPHNAGSDSVNNAVHFGNDMPSTCLDKMVCSELPVQMEAPHTNESKTSLAQQAGQDLSTSSVVDLQKSTKLRKSVLAFHLMLAYKRLAKPIKAAPDSSCENQKPRVSQHKLQKSNGPLSVSHLEQLLTRSENDPPMTQETCTDASQDSSSLTVDVCKRTVGDENTETMHNSAGSTEVPIKQGGQMNETHEHEDAEVQFVGLSSVPVIPWTYRKLTNLIDEISKTQKPNSFPEINSSNELMRIFWNNSQEKLLSQIKAHSYINIMTEVKKYYCEHVKSDSVILSQVDRRELKKVGQIKNRLYVCKPDYVHSKVPYVSSWLNVNEQLDDIDKEFGFPRSLTHVAERENDISENPHCEMQKEVVPRTDHEMCASIDKEILDASCPQTLVGDAETTEQNFSFQIQVLPPDMTKIIYEQIQSVVVQRGNIDSQSEKAMNVSTKGDLHEAEVPSSEAKSGENADCYTEEFCCNTRWLKLMKLFNNLPLGHCQCQQETEKDVTVTEFEKEKEAPKHSLGMITSEYAQEPTMEEGCEAAGGLDKVASISTSTTEQCKISGTISHTEEIRTLCSDSSKLNVLLISEGEQSTCTKPEKEEIVNLPSSSKGKLPNRTSDLKEELKPISPALGKVHINLIDKPVGYKSNIDNYLAFSSLGHLNHLSPHLKRLNLTSKHKAVKKKRKKTLALANGGIIKLINKALPDAAESRPILTVKKVKLSLYGSSAQKKVRNVNGRNELFRRDLSAGAPAPPEVLNITVASWHRRPSETVPLLKSSLKRRLHEEWKNSFPPYKKACRNKGLTLKIGTSGSLTTQKSKTVHSTNSKNCPVSYEKPKWGLSLSRRRAILRNLKHYMEKQKYKTPKKGADFTSRKYESRMQAVKENHVLKFSVLPNAFSFRDGPTETTDSSVDIPAASKRVASKEDGSKETVNTKRGASWVPNPETTFCPPSSNATAPNAAAIFQEFKKRHGEKHPLSTANKKDDQGSNDTAE